MAEVAKLLHPCPQSLRSKNIPQVQLYNLIWELCSLWVTSTELLKKSHLELAVLMCASSTSIEKLRQRDCKFKASLSCGARSHLRKVKQKKKNPVHLTIGLVAQSCFLMRVSLGECVKCSSQCLNSGFFLIPFRCQEHLFSLPANICHYGKRMAGNGWWQLIIETGARQKGASQARARRRTSLQVEHLQGPSMEKYTYPVTFQFLTRHTELGSRQIH